MLRKEKARRERASLKRKARTLFTKILSKKVLSKGEVAYLDCIKDLSDEYYFVVLNTPGFEDRIK